MKDEYYNSHKARLDTIAGRNLYWIRLISAKKEFDDLYLNNMDDPSLVSFNNYMHNTYGIDINSDSSGKILPTYNIIDEHKYLIFLLKHGNK